MPVKRRNAKRRIDLAEQAEAWAIPFGAGFDFFRELHAIGVEVDENGRPDREAARAAWAVFGPEFLLNRDPAVKLSWGEREFGRPWEVGGDDAG